MLMRFFNALDLAFFISVGYPPSLRTAPHSPPLWKAVISGREPPAPDEVSADGLLRLVRVAVAPPVRSVAVSGRPLALPAGLGLEPAVVERLAVEPVIAGFAGLTAGSSG